MRLSSFVFGVACLAALPSPGAERAWMERACEAISTDLRRTTARLAEISAELPRLPLPPGVPSGTSSGFSTNPVLPEQEQQWLAVTLAAPVEIDSVALFPAVSMGAGRPIEGFGFPKRFTIEADAGDGSPPWIVLDQSAADFPNPGIYPVVCRFAARRVQRVRVKVVASWQEEAPSVLALSELMLLAGNRNVAVGARVEASSFRDSTVAWQRSNLVDMSTPLGLPAVPGDRSTLGYHSGVEKSTDHPKSVTLELPVPAALDDVRLVPVVREGLPGWVSYGFPPRVKIELAQQPDFSDARVLFQSTNKDLPAPGRNVVIYKADGVTARYIRVTSQRLWHRANDFLFALAEVQTYAGGSNVALSAPATATDADDEEGWSVAALTDGAAYQQRLIELPEWLTLLERRRQILAEQTQLSDLRLTQIAHAQDILARLAGGLGLTLSLAATLGIWRQKRRSRLEKERLQERLARDLHDDIGSNLGSISLLCNIVTQHPEDTTPHHEDFAEIQRIATESADSMRDMIQLLNPRSVSPGGDWVQVLQQLAERIVRGASLHFERHDGDASLGPDLESRRELYLFCKEALTNITRHARASEVGFAITLTPVGLDLKLTDNGIGFDPAKKTRGFGLGNLRQRAQQMRGDLRIDSRPGGGTSLCLHIPRQRGWLAI